MPAPSCAPVSVPFTMQFFRTCFGAAGCSGTCIGANSPWTMTLDGRTVEFTNAGTPFSMSSASVCAGSNLTATSNGVQYGVPAYSINWSFSPTGIPSVGTGNSPSINFPTAGAVTLYAIVTDACGVTATGSQNINVVAIPTANAGTNRNLTCIQTTTVLNGTGGGTYSWSGPGTITTPTSQNPTVNTPGTFSLTVNVAGCNSPISTVVVTQNTTAPVTSAGTTGSITCSNLTINLTNTLTGATYTWTAPGGSSITGGVNNQNTTGSGAGTYTVRVTDAVNGCTNIATVAALVNTVAPVTSAGTTGSITCTNSAINLTSTLAGANYTWTAPGGSSITGGVNSQNTTGSGPGTYTVRVQDAVNGCTTTATVAALINTVNPIPTAGTSASVTCTNSVINLTSTPASGVSYTWTAPGGSSITGGVNSQNTTGSGPGTYTVRVQDAVNGCTNIATVAALVNTVAPTTTAGIAGLVTCSSPTVSLTSGPSGMSYTWTAPGGSSITGGVNSQTTTGSGAGTYSVIVQNPVNGCSTSSVVSASTNTTPPTPAITAPSTITCSNPTITLTSPTGGVTYTWSGPGIVGSANNSTVNVNQVGTYSLSVTSAVNGCTNSISASVGNNTIAPTTTPIGTQTITCATPSVQLIGSANPSSCTVVWTGGVCAGATSYTASACAAGNYTYIATNPANGCQSAAQVATVVPNAGVPTATLSNTGTITCLTTSVQVVGTTTTSPATYTWSGPGIVGVANTPTINVNQGGVYTLTLTNTLNGCTSVVTNSITADNAAVTPTTTSSTTITCTNPTSTLTTNVGAGSYSYNWSGPGIVGTNTLSTATSSLGGTYNVTVTNTSNGCVGIGTISVASNTTVPASVTVTPSSYTLSCATPTTQIVVGSPTGGTTFSWTAPGTGNILSGGTTQTVSISGPGVYSVVATATNGCSAAVTTATMVADVNSPNVTLSSPNLSITCISTTPSLTLTPTGTVVIASYSWSPASGISSGSNTTTPTFTASGNYTCLITAANGCTITATIPVTDNTVTPTATTSAIANISCASTSVDINPTYTPSTGLTYTWTGTGIVGSANNSSVTVNQSGTYTVSMIDPVNGCASTATMTVNGNTVAPTVTVTSTSTIGIGCLPTNTAVILDATTTPSTGVNYVWSTTATTQTISVTTAGVYTVVITDAVNGCSVATQYTVTNSSVLPNVSAGANANIPCGGLTTTVTLNGNSTDPGVNYAWVGPGMVSGSNTATPIVNVAGTYTLTVTNPTTGCSATSTVDVINAVPTASISSDVVTGFAPLTVNFGNTSTNANTFSWNFGNGNSSVLTTTASTSSTYGWGTYTITMIASSGLCSDTASIVIVVEDGFSIEVPNVFTPNDDNINDVFTITSTGVKEITLKIFNRWGQPMYDFSGAKASWDGVTSNGQKASNGTYFYFIKAVGFDGKEYEKNGPVSLFR
ncbi:MAG: gliding motility-associated C-terminal domain-containing protein [Sphingobacteriaceae bacterium]|nr:gliding motility-associated C-terminal domain-containing protein [Sphingobacteriaceae bacterium]